MYFLQQWLSLLEYVHGSYYKEPRLRVGAPSICLRKGLKEQLPHQPHQPHTNQSSFPLVYFLWDSDSMARKILKITAAQVTWPKYTAALDKSWYGSAGKAAMQETWVRSPGQEDPLEKGMATHSSILAWRIPWTERPSGLESVGSQRVGHDQAISTLFFLVGSILVEEYEYILHTAQISVFLVG